MNRKASEGAVPQNHGSTAVSLVLPVSLSERLTAESRLLWRANVNVSALARFRCLLASLRTFVADFRNLEFLLICPEDQVRSVIREAEPYTEGLRGLTVVGQDRVIGRTYNKVTEAPDSWYIQQAVKLAAAQIVSNPFYLTLDSDVLARRQFSVDDLVVNGRARTNSETTATYEDLYVDAFAHHEKRLKRARFARAEQILGVQQKGTVRDRFYGETPVVLESSAVRELQTLVARRSSCSWSDALLSLDGWSEYSLYYSFLEAKDSVEKICELGGSNTVLDLPRSAWQPRACYKEHRDYRPEHLFTEEGGCFVVLQSWLSKADWLPLEYASIEVYYEKLENYLASK